VVERHLSHEERDPEPELVRQMASPEWMAVEKKLRSEPPGVIGRYFAWLTDGISAENRRT
jgi:hypothetical protein